MLKHQQSPARIQWNTGSLDNWDDLLKKVPRSNLLQSWPYAQMMRAKQQMSTRFGQLLIEGEIAAIFQIHEVKLGPLYHVVTLDRGPLWLKSNPSLDDWRSFLEAYAQEFPKKLGRRRRLMPELESSPETQRLMLDCGFQARAPGYQSIWLDLTKTLDELRKGLKQKWRNALNQSEKKNLDVHTLNDPASFNWLMTRYGEDRSQKKYRGPSVAMLKSLYQFSSARDEVFMLSATSAGEIIASILIFKHGRSATYQVGWTSEQGRDTKAHQLLLWHAIEALQAEGFTSFDLGGIHPEQAAGLTQFKRGLGGEEFELVGIYS